MSRPPSVILTEYYGMPGATLTPTELGAINDNYFVTWGGREYVLKRYRPEYNAPDHVRRVCGVQGSLRAGLIPVPELIVNTRGQIVTEADGTCYVLAVRAPGRHFGPGEVPPAAAADMGRVLGRMIRLLANWGPAEPYALTSPGAAAVTLQALLKKAELGTEPVDAVACDVLRYQLAALERLAAYVPQLVALPAQWVHGDYQLTNILFDAAGHVTAVLDFDNLRCRPRSTEFMRALALCFAPQGEGLSDSALAFFRGYAEIVRPSPDEVSLYAPLRAYLNATGTWPIGTRYLEPDAYQSRWDRYIKPPSDWWERNTDTVTASLLAELAALPAGTASVEPNLRISADTL